MARYHSLEEPKLPIACGDTPLKRVSCTKLLGVHVDQHLTWKKHVAQVLISSSYGTLSVLRRLKHLVPFHVRKHLAGSLVLSKVNYACTVFHPPSSISNEAPPKASKCMRWICHKKVCRSGGRCKAESGTFQHSAATISNKLPIAIGNIT